MKAWEDTTDFLTQLARNSGKLLRGGEPDLKTAARMVLYDWQRGKIPYFSLPPDYEDRGSALDRARKPSQAVTVNMASGAQLPSLCLLHSSVYMRLAITPEPSSGFCFAICGFRWLVKRNKSLPVLRLTTYLSPCAMKQNHKWDLFHPNFMPGIPFGSPNAQTNN